MAAYTKGKRLSQLKVESAMSKGFFSCKAEDSLAAAEATMRDWQVRRLPVVDANDQLVGLLSISDIVRARSANKCVFHDDSLTATCVDRCV